MPKPHRRAALAAALAALAFTLAGGAAQAQFNPGGGQDGGMGGVPPGSGGRDRDPPGGATPAPAAPAAPPPKPPKPMNQIDITGVIQSLGPDPRTVTIAYDPVDELGWPQGVMQFNAYKADVLKPVTVGERVRFRLDSQQIVWIGPF
jgi:hypothetical protein